MKTSELIEKARQRAKSWADLGSDADEHMYNALADRLEKAYIDLHETRDCESCVYDIEPFPHICVGCSHSAEYYPDWKWRGDEE